MNNQFEIEVEGRKVLTLRDILPTCMKMLIIGKSPARVSAQKGHYFQGRQGKLLWSRLKEYGLLKVPPGKYDDEVLAKFRYGITDIVKVPRDFGSEPTDVEYRKGLRRILELVGHSRPHVLFLVYKRVLDKILELAYHWETKSHYGFNPELETLFQCKVFVFPMPGTPCKTEEAILAMNELKAELKR